MMSDKSTGSSTQDPSRVFALATGYWDSAAFLAANSLGIFQALSEGPLDAAAVARRLVTDPRATRMLLETCVALGLVSYGEDGYALEPSVAPFLTPGHTAYLGAAFDWSRDQYGPWGTLERAVRSGGPVVPMADHLGDDDAQTRSFVLGMHQRAAGMARGVVRFLDIGEAEELLDVGGGPGTYSVMLAGLHPRLRPTVLDVPGVIRWTRVLVADAGLAERVQTIPGDGKLGEYGEDRWDAILFSGVLHQMSEETILRMFRGAFRALRSGGAVIVSDVMRDSSGAGPLFATLFSLQMLLTTDEGAVFRSDDCAAWLTDTGFVSTTITPLPPPLPYVVVRGLKP